MAEFRTYVDSGVLVKLYHLESGSQEVARLIRKESSLPLPFLAEMEVRNALRALHGRHVLRAEVLAAALEAFESDIASGRLKRVAPDPFAWQSKAELLSAKHTSATLCRTLDLFHVALALTLEVRSFITGDHRQAALARASGLRVTLLQQQGS